MKKLRLLLITLCVSVLMGSMAVTAYAGGGEEWDGLAPVEPLPAETVDPGEGFTEDGNLVTRDLLYDKATNKQFITVQTSGGNTFYIIIDYDKPTDEDGEQYQTYFLNMVDEADLLALAVVVIGGGAGWYFKIYRPKKQRAAESEADYGGEYDGAEDYDETDPEDDGPPWDEDGEE